MANVPLAPAVNTATATKRRQVKKAGATAIAGGAGGASTHQLIENGLLVLVVISGFIIIAVAISVFNAWRQSQRADALTAAIKDVKAKETAAFAARLAADAQASANQKIIDAEQVALATAKYAIKKVQPSQPK